MVGWHQYQLLVQSLSRVQLFKIPWTAALQASLSFAISQSLLKLMSFDLVMLSNHCILYHTLLLLYSNFPSIRVFSNELTLPIRWPNYWSFSNSPSMNIQGWFPLGLNGLISMLSKGLSRVFSNTTIQNCAQPCLCPALTSIHDYWENHSFD